MPGQQLPGGQYNGNLPMQQQPPQYNQQGVPNGQAGIAFN